MTMNYTAQSNTQPVLLTEYSRNDEFEAEMQQDSNQLILMLLQGAIDKGNLAKACYQSKDFTEQGFHLGRMTSILDALRDRLHFSESTPLAYDLEKLYEYSDQCVQKAVFEQHFASLDSAIEVLSQLRDGWIEMLEAQVNESKLF